jgi:hypothetical protein
MKNWTASIITSIICRLIGLIAVLVFVYLMVVLTGKLSCLWLLFLLFAVELVPTYEFKTKNSEDKGDKKE